MKIPQNTRIYEHPMATCWLDAEGILYAVSKPIPRTIDLLGDYIKFVKKVCRCDKVCLIADIDEATPMDTNTKKYAAKHLPEIYKAMAILATSKIASENGSIYLNLVNEGYPIRMFVDKRTAKDWIRQYL
jgi:hypothetical protein